MGWAGKGEKRGEFVAQAQNEEAERNWPDLLCQRSWIRCRAGNWSSLIPGQVGSSTEEQRELCSSPFILQVREGSAAAGKLPCLSLLWEISHFSLSFSKSEHFVTLKTEENSRLTWCAVSWSQWGCGEMIMKFYSWTGKVLYNNTLLYNNTILFALQWLYSKCLCVSLHLSTNWLNFGIIWFFSQVSELLKGGSRVNTCPMSALKWCWCLKEGLSQSEKSSAQSRRTCHFPLHYTSSLFNFLCLAESWLKCCIRPRQPGCPGKAVRRDVCLRGWMRGVYCKMMKKSSGLCLGKNYLGTAEPFLGESGYVTTSDHVCLITLCP